MAVFSAGCCHRNADGVTVDGASTQPVMFHIAGVCHRDGIGVGLFCRRFAFFDSGGRYVKEVTAGMRDLAEAVSVPMAWKVTGVQPKYKNYVLVIGESNRWDYVHAYGYPLENTPFMESKGPLLEGMISVADYTIPSLQKALTKTSKDASVNYAMTVVDLANCAGFKTYWFSNQGYIDKKK